ncbi:MFS transporter [Streptosporangium sp. NPDC051023]|uniref:MFS transporter n=1 Tax=Streptosporangium sp. NPDC051023 TaxID=3155410 RepID=UPI00344EDC5B
MSSTIEQNVSRVGRRRLNLLILTAAQALAMCGAAIDLTVTGLAGMRLAPDPALATAPFALITVATALGTYPASALMARIGRRAGFLLGSAAGLLSGLASVAAVTIHSFWLLCLSTAAIGLYQAFGGYYRYAAADDAPPYGRTRALSTVMAAGVVAAVVGPFVATSGQDLLSAPFAGSYLIVAALAAGSAVTLLFLRLTPEGAGSRPDPAGDAATGAGAGTEPDLGAGVGRARGTAARPARVVLTRPIFVAGVGCAAVGQFAMMLLMTASPLAAVAHHHTVADGAMVVQWHLVGMFVTSPLSGRIVERYGATAGAVAGALLLATGAALAVTGDSRPHFVAALALVGVGWNFLSVTGGSLVVHAYLPPERARTQAAAELLGAAGATAGSVSAGALLALLGWNGLNGATLLFLAVAACLLARPLLLARPVTEPPVSRPGDGAQGLPQEESMRSSHK